MDFRGAALSTTAAAAVIAFHTSSGLSPTDVRAGGRFRLPNALEGYYMMNMKRLRLEGFRLSRWSAFVESEAVAEGVNERFLDQLPSAAVDQIEFSICYGAD